MGFCEECQWKFQNIRLHKRLFHGHKEEHWCSTCGRLYSEALYLKRHKDKECLGSKFQCYVCSKTDFTSAESFSAHLEMHLEVHVYLCEKCPKTFMKRQACEEHSLMMHEKTPLESENNAMRVASPKPSVSFKDSNEQTEDYVYCDDCCHGFVQIDIHHALVHRGKPQLLCNLCGQQFVKSKTFHVHFNSHQLNTIKCYVCDVEMESSKGLYKHLEEHNSLHTLLCSSCPKTFALVNNFDMHYKKKHSDAHNADGLLNSTKNKSRSFKTKAKNIANGVTDSDSFCYETNENENSPPVLKDKGKLSSKKKRKYLKSLEDDVQTPAANNHNKTERDLAIPFSGPKDVSNAQCALKEKINQKDKSFVKTSEKRSGLKNSVPIVEHTSNKSTMCLVKSPSFKKEHISKKYTKSKSSKKKCVVRLDNVFDNLLENNMEESSNIFANNVSADESDLNKPKKSRKKKILRLPNEAESLLRTEDVTLGSNCGKKSGRFLSVQVSSTSDVSLDQFLNQPSEQSDTASDDDLVSSSNLNKESEHQSYNNRGESSCRDSCGPLGLKKRTWWNNNLTPNVSQMSSRKNNPDQVQRKRKRGVSESATSDVLDLDELLSDDGKDSDVDHVCFHCRQRFNKLNLLYRHYVLEHNNGALDCKTCGKVFHRDFSLYFDSMRHAKLYPWECTICSNTFKNKSYYRRHLKKVHGKFKKYKCELCDESFVYYLPYSAHVAEHNEDRRFTCEHCSKQYLYKKFVGNHIENIKCKQCHITFPCKTLFKHHLDTVHPFDSLFQCPYCDQEFKARDILRRHLTIKHFDKVVKNPVFCKFCDYVTHCKSNLSRHIKRHTN